MKQLGYRSIIPVAEEDFAEQEIRETWAREKNMQVFCLHSDQLPGTTIDIFVADPFDFDSEYKQALVAEIGDALEVRVVSINTLIKMKSDAGRTRDRDDIEHLKMICDEKSN